MLVELSGFKINQTQSSYLAAVGMTAYVKANTQLSCYQRVIKKTLILHAVHYQQRTHHPDRLRGHKMKYLGVFARHPAQLWI